MQVLARLGCASSCTASFSQSQLPDVLGVFGKK